ncbi:MAG: spore cortex biosynthesis protein YabQ [Clostridia bacterium]|nr:spore cortex biosynthesis protein YabQ [Clostridia bacterium]
MIYCRLYDLFRILRKTVKQTVVSVFIEDLLFWLLITFLSFLFLLSRTNGEVRGYVLLGMSFGFVLCRLTISRLLVPAEIKILGAVLSFFAFLECKKTAFLVTFISHFEQFLKNAGKKLLFLLKKGKKGLKKGYKMLYTKRKSKKTNHSEI